MYAHFYPAAELLGKIMVPILIEVRARSVEEMGGLVRHSGEEYLYVLVGTMETPFRSIRATRAGDRRFALFR